VGGRQGSAAIAVRSYGSPLKVHQLHLGLANAYLLESRDAMALVDAGSKGAERAVIDRMKVLGRQDLQLIFITHAHLDHYGSAAALRRLTGARIAVHHADAAYMMHGETPLGRARGRGQVVALLFPLIERLLGPEPTPPDLLLEDGDPIKVCGLDASLVHSPGHTPGSSCLVVQGGFAFAGDLISTSGGAHVQRFYAHDWALIPSSLARLGELHPEVVYPGHGRDVLDGAGLHRLIAETNARSAD
jgi:hydroxyacylglutathione hydrolase